MQTNSWHVLYVKVHLCKIYFALFQGSLTTAGRSEHYTCIWSIYSWFSIVGSSSTTRFMILVALQCF